MPSSVLIERDTNAHLAVAEKEVPEPAEGRGQVLQNKLSEQKLEKP